MEKEFDDFLRHALSPKDEPDFGLNQKILNRVKEQSTMAGRKSRRVSVATLVAAKETGRISRNEAYEGLNALFDLPVHVSKANPKKAAEYIESLGLEADIAEAMLNVELEEDFKVIVVEDNKKGAEVVEYALQFVGNPYVWTGDSLTEGADSSGFVKSVYEHFEIGLPHDSGKQKELGTEVEALENAMPGDLVFYDTPSHVAIYMGDGVIIHAMPQEGICVSRVDFDNIISIRRILGIE